MHGYDNIVEALQGLKKRGFVYDFNLTGKGIACREKTLTLAAPAFEIVEYYRFEANTNPSDSNILYDSADTFIKGVFVNAYGVYSDALSDSMIENWRYPHYEWKFLGRNEKKS